MSGLRGRAWLAALPLALGIAAAFGWWQLRGPERISPAEKKEPSAVEAKLGPGDSRSAEVLALVRDKSLDGRERLLDAYRRWAGDPRATAARRVLLGALFAEPSLGLKLQRVLNAVAADPTPPDEDPLWSTVVENLSSLWTPDNFDKGRDLMLAEERDRPRQALIESWTRLAEADRITDLSMEQRHKLASDLIDLYATADPSQKPEVAGALNNLMGGSDVTQILSGGGLEADGPLLQAEVENERVVQRGTQVLLAEPAGEAGDEPRPLPPDLEDDSPPDDAL